MMQNEQNSSTPAGLIPQEPIPEGAREFSERLHGLMDGKSKDDATVERALEGMDDMLDTIAARLYSLASMLVGEGENAVKLVETAIATTDISACNDPVEGRKLSRLALSKAALKMIAERDPDSMAAPKDVEPVGGCIDDDDLDAAGVSRDELEHMMSGPDRDRMRVWLENLPVDVRTVFALRAVAGFAATETSALLAEFGGQKAAGWTPDAVRTVFRLGLCSLASQLIQATVRS